MMRSDPFDLTGRNAVVTGASRGIGASIAKGLLRAGAAVAITGRNLDDLQACAATLSADGGTVVAISADVADVEASKAAIVEAAGQLGGLDILVNNAGTEEVRPSIDVDEALWDRILDTNLKGAFFCSQALARLARDRARPAAIINLCSLTSTLGVPGAAPYGSSKSGLLGMTRALAAEWAPLDIRVNAIAPGYFRTAMTEVFYGDESWRQSMLGKIPQRRFGDLDDLQGVAVFLASDASAYISGQCITVDGGFLASI